ncbi:bifunctional diguanylate cyclase/phosphodiesterase [uncultured Pseudokineococcus sp.]|uniref:putative bifunctional diguanylate cyclase/phosphodiesterase n=1 Tax=uncultured Pseudokineococcus sp. TaxID=1642928 RepID=UPI00260FCC70|nr:bifunctional diguanylate cyclase/phosphodiesterase [uncultured Pseudokineococcus sp.]
MATPRAVGSAFGVLYVAGGLAALVVAAGVDGVGAGVGPARALIAAIGVLAVVIGTAAAVLREHLPAGVAHLLVTGGTVLITTAVLVSPDPGTALALSAVYTFIAVDIFVFFSLRSAFLHLSVCLVTATAALAARDALHHAVALDVVLVAIAVVVGLLAKKASDASLDSLTGLPNRRGLDEALDRTTRTAERTGEPLSVALLDLDGFKEVNDAGGHAAGDELLRTTATRWRAALPDHAVLARLGGDEFAVLLPGAGSAALAELLDPLVRDRRAPASAGVADAPAEQTPTEVLRRADAALYDAKRSGRGRCAVAGEDPVAEGEASLVEDLARALRTGGLDVHYQAVFESTPGDGGGPLRAVEALARWDHPERGPVSPAVFVALAEAHGLVTDLGALVLERACRELMSLPPQVRGDLYLGVNVSGLELVRPGYVRRVAEVLERTGWPVERLVLEITESVVEADGPRALAAVREASALGLLISVDDFGTGYSALSRLDEVPASYLKLDSSFTATVHTSPRRARLVGAVTALSQTLDLTVVAEGVETAEQADVLLGLGCTLLQGYHLGRPEPLAALADRLREASARAATPPPALPAVPVPRRGTPAAAAVLPSEDADV